ncbi:HEAT repeat domain-containing protein, partial [Planctomycetota bacterium]
YGRYPTLGEVREYYSRDEFIDFLSRTAAYKRVWMIIPERLHWEIKREERVPVAGSEDLRAYIKRRIDERFPDGDENARLSFYPSFHQSLERWEPGMADKGQHIGVDGTAEADLPLWRNNFNDALTLLRVLQDENIPHHFKFSGSRSLHVMIPCANQKVNAGIFGNSRAHHAAILRMPFSLNEDTGLVSLPLNAETLPAFRPWQAGMHVVKFEDSWLIPTDEEGLARIAEFMHGLKEREPVAREEYFEPSLKLDAIQETAGQLCAGITEPHPLCLEPNSSQEDLRSRLLRAEGESRWLTAEAFLLHGEELDEDLLAHLLQDADPYMRSANVDIMARFRDTACRYFVTCMSSEDMGAASKSLYLLAHSGTLRSKFMEYLQAESRASAPLVLRVACATGVLGRDWNLADSIIADAEDEFGDAPGWDKRVQALKLMRTLMTSWGKTQAPPELVDMGTDITDLLLLAMTSDSRRHRWAFLKPLCLIADPDALEVYIEALGDSYRDSAKWATAALVSLGKEAVPALIEAAASDDARVRRYAIRCLGHIGDERARESIVEALEDEDEKIARQAVLALRDIVKQEDIPLLQIAIRAAPYEIRREIVRTLDNLGSEGHQVLEALALEQGEPAAAGWLFRQGDLRGKPVLLAALEKEGMTQEAAVMELADGPADDDALGALIKALPEFKWVAQITVADALLKIGDPGGLEAFLVLAEHKDMTSRKLAAHSLGQWHAPEALEMLMRLLRDKHKKVRARSADGLFCQGEYAREILENYLQEHKVNSHPRDLAQRVLNSLDLKRGLEAGKPMDNELFKLLQVSWDPARDNTAACLRERNDPGDLTFLVGKLSSARSSIRWMTRCLLIEIGDAVIGAVREFIQQSDDEVAKQQAEEVLVELGED